MGHQQPSMSCGNKLVMGVAGADHHHLLCCTWRTPVRHLCESNFSPKTVQVSVQCMLVPHSCGLQRQAGKSICASIIQVRGVFTEVPQREVSVSIYKLYLWQLCLLTGGTVWQNSREIGIHLAPPGTLLDAVHIAGCFKFLTLEELSCMVLFQTLFCLLTGILSDCWVLSLNWGMF